MILDELKGHQENSQIKSAIEYFWESKINTSIWSAIEESGKQYQVEYCRKTFAADMGFWKKVTAKLFKGQMKIQAYHEKMEYN